MGKLLRSLLGWQAKADTLGQSRCPTYFARRIEQQRHLWHGARKEESERLARAVDPDRWSDCRGDL